MHHKIFRKLYFFQFLRDDFFVTLEVISKHINQPLHSDHTHTSYGDIHIWHKSWIFKIEKETEKVHKSRYEYFLTVKKHSSKISKLLVQIYIPA